MNEERNNSNECVVGDGNVRHLNVRPSELNKRGWMDVVKRKTATEQLNDELKYSGQNEHTAENGKPKQTESKQVKDHLSP